VTESGVDTSDAGVMSVHTHHDKEGREIHKSDGCCSPGTFCYIAWRSLYRCAEVNCGCLIVASWRSSAAGVRPKEKNGSFEWMLCWHELRLLRFCNQANDGKRSVVVLHLHGVMVMPRSTSRRSDVSVTHFDEISKTDGSKARVQALLWRYGCIPLQHDKRSEYCAQNSTVFQRFKWLHLASIGPSCQHPTRSIENIHL
jgi:hypothetical protein